MSRARSPCSSRASRTRPRPPGTCGAARRARAAGGDAEEHAAPRFAELRQPSSRRCRQEEEVVAVGVWGGQLTALRVRTCPYGPLPAHGAREGGQRERSAPLRVDGVAARIIGRGDGPGSCSGSDAGCTAHEHRRVEVTCAVGCDVKQAVLESSRLTQE